MVEVPSPPYIPAMYYGGHQGTINRIVMHGTVSSTYCGGAKAIALYFQNPTYVSSAHYVVDNCSTYQCVYDNTVAYHAPPNWGSIGIEMCDPVNGDPSRWEDAEHQAMLNRAARLVHDLCLVYDVPMTWLYPNELVSGSRGITDHENVGIAWGQTSHYDPNWSAARSESFMDRVRNAGLSSGGGAAPASEPKEDDMPSAHEVAEAVWNHAVSNGILDTNSPAWARLSWIDAVVWRNNAALNKLAEQQGIDVDEQAIVEGVLTGLTPEKIAAAIPSDVAVRVADELTRRLAE